MGELHRIKPGMLGRDRRLNWYLVAIILGTLLVWFVLVIAVLRAMT